MHESGDRKRQQPESDQATPSAKAPKLSEFMSGSSVVCQRKVDDLMLNFVVSDMQPLSVLEGGGFKRLMEYVNPRVKVMCYETLKTRLIKKFEAVLEQVKTEIADVQYVCTTADIWSQQARSYLGITCHWIDPCKLIRRSAVLAFRRFYGTHSFDRIGAMLMSIHTQFDLDTSKITHVVTDNGSNFMKAFRHYAQDGVLNESLEDEKDDYDVASVSDVLTQKGDDDEALNAIYLPPHVSCMSHSLNLIASTDAAKALNSSNQYKKLYRSVSAKCTALSNAVHVSSKNAEIAQELLHCTIPKPNTTRWNSEFDCLKRVYEVRDRINTVMERLKLPKLVDVEVEFLGEWLEVMQPVATALDKMQGENTVDSYFGAVLPTLHAIKRKFNSFVPKHTEALVSSLLAGLHLRFGYILSLDDFCGNTRKKALLIASVAHPYFKLRWLPTAELQQVAEDLFLVELVRVNSAENTVNQPTASAESDDFYGFAASPGSSNCDCKVSGIQYLRDPSHDFQQLNSYPSVARVFLKFNTTIPSSAPVERLFSAAGQILLPRRNRLSDEMFEKLLFLKKNGEFFSRS